MACLAMHLAVAEKFLDKNKNENSDEFINGTLQPDLERDKISSHFGTDKKPETVRQMLEYKMDIVKAAKMLELNNSFNRAYFLHLICDDIFYRFVYNEKLEKWSPTEIKQAMYDDYDFVTKYIIDKYKIKLPKQLNGLANVKEGKSVFFSTENIDDFITVFSNVNLSEAKNLIVADLESFRSNIINTLNKNKNKSF